MEFKWHLLFGFVSSYILIQFFDFHLSTGLIIFLSSWMIDGDHYLWYAFETKNYNPLCAIKWYNESIPKWSSLTLKEREEFKRGIFIFHSIGFWVLLLILSFIHPVFLWILIGVAIHMSADLPHLIYRGESVYNKIFLTAVIRRNKNKKSFREL